MESETRYVIVGVIISSLLVALSLSVFWLLSNNKEVDTRDLRAHIIDQSLAGLQTGAPVTMRGIKIGQVGDIEFASSVSDGVWVNLAIKSSIPLGVDTTAEIQRNLVTGLATVELVSSGSTLENAATPFVIGESKGALAEISQSASGVLERTSKVLDQLSLIFSEKNANAVAAILNRTELLFNGVSQNQGGLESIVKRLDSSAASLEALINSGSGFLQGVDNSISESKNTLTTEMRQISRSVAEIARSVALVSAQYDDPSKLLRGPAQSNLGPGEGHNE